MKAENISQHGSYLRDGAWVVVNSENVIPPDMAVSVFAMDADSLAQKIGNIHAVNLVLLGFALAEASHLPDDKKNLFCSLADLKSVMENQMADNKERLDASIKAIEAGYCFGNRK